MRICKELSKSDRIKITNSDNDDYIEYTLSGSTRPMISWLEMGSYISEVEGYLKMRRESGKINLYYNLWPSKGYKDNLVKFLIAYAIIICIPFTIIFYALLSTDMISSIIGGVIVGVIAAALMNGWSLYGLDVGLSNQENVIKGLLMDNISGFDSIKRSYKDRGARY